MKVEVPPTGGSASKKAVAIMLTIAFVCGSIVMYLALHYTPSHVGSRFAGGMKAHQHDVRGERVPSTEVNDACGMKKWLTDHGGRILEDGVMMADMQVTLPNGHKMTRRGLQAKRALAQGEEIVFVPKSMMMNNDTAAESDIGWLFKKATYLDDADITTLFLLHENEKPDSFWRPYMCHLPKVAPQPIFFDAEQLKAFKAAFVRKGDEPALFKFLMTEKALDDAVEEMRANYKTRYQQGLQRVQRDFPEQFPKDKYTEEKFNWAYGMLSSRSFAWVTDYAPAGIYAMMPFADMPNRDRAQLFQQLRSVISAADGENVPHPDEVGMSLDVAKPVGEGRELFANYGPDCTEHFVMNYGFLPAYCQDEMLGHPVQLAE